MGLKDISSEFGVFYRLRSHTRTCEHVSPDSIKNHLWRGRIRESDIVRSVSSNGSHDLVLDNSQCHRKTVSTIGAGVKKENESVE